MVGSAIPLPPRFVEEERGGNAHVERLTGVELERVGVAKRLTPREDALVVARARGLRQVTLELPLHARPFDVRQPRLAPDRTLARPQLEHLTRPTQRLAHRAAPVDEL